MSVIELDKKVPILKSQRLELREITEKDTDFIVKLRANPDIYKYFSHPHAISRDEHVDWYKSVYLKDVTKLNWIALLRDNPIGVFGLNRVKGKNMEAEIGYILSNEYYGHGYASEAIRTIVDWSRDNWGCKAIIAEIHKENVSSIRFVLRNGFKYEKSDENFNIYRIEI